MIIALTPTGGRPEAFALCERWMKRQTRQPDLWIVVDDVMPPTPRTMRQVAITPTDSWTDGSSTQARNILAGLDFIEQEVPGEHGILFIEDDDWYAPDYIEKQAARLEEAEMVGEQPARYYHVRHAAYRAFEPTPHASLAATAIRSSMIPAVREACELASYIDMYLWRKYGHPQMLYNDTSVVGIKGMPGRPGVSAAHRRETGGYWTPDTGGAKLREWIGEDSTVYKQFIGGQMQAPPPVEYDNPENFPTFKFAGVTQYRCPDCGFDSSIPSTVTKHWIDSHKVEHETTGPGVTLFDANNKPIERRLVDGSRKA
jgi:hypothetical protein